MTPPQVHWFVLAGGLSPYTLDLWDRVVARSGHSVTLAYIPRECAPDFVHERESLCSNSVELVPVQSFRTAAALALRCVKATQPVVVCMGHSPIYNVAISALARALGRGKRLVLYVSDTNGVALINRTALSRIAESRRMLKRAALGSIFATSLDLGFSNALAHRMLGIRRGIDLPILPVDFPEELELALPESLASAIRDLPRPRLLTMARLVDCKNLVAQATAFVEAVRGGAPGSLTIIGEGPERVRLEPLFRQIPGRALLPGAVPFRESRRLFPAFDAALLVSTQDQWGIAIVEALGWGLPVLSSWQCGAGVSMALEAGDAVKLCGTSSKELTTSLLCFLRDLERHKAAAMLAAPGIRSQFATTAVADGLTRLATESLSEL